MLVLLHWTFPVSWLWSQLRRCQEWILLLTMPVDLRGYWWLWHLLRHIFCYLCWVNTIVYISLISLLFRYAMTMFLISCGHLSIVFNLFLVWLYSLLRCIILTQINLCWSLSYVSHALFPFPTLSYFILHVFIPYLNRITACYILMQSVCNQFR